jgi:HTH-type transcriptional regulator/antitoxin MqsA
MKREQCVVCGKGLAREMAATRTVTVRGKGYRIPRDRFMRCGACGEEYYTGAQARASTTRLLALRRAREGLLTPEEIREVRHRLRLSQRALEKILGLGPKTVVRWERGTVLQSKAADDVLRLIDRDESNLRLLAKVRQIRGLKVAS